ncbi:hypothetical protein HPP92_015081 [Vanilla planifolia]|uniref:DNA-directed primase/polymerase protein n=1 Tax=Vanilla planifolia TaxID=51239 RepID=A0A835QII6_VANPL|nr:hypothetical protein HPP92_015081 [Vanilla planifolia]
MDVSFQRWSSAAAEARFQSGKQISPAVFYGSPLGVPVKKPSRILRLLQEIRVDLIEESALVPRGGLWATFPRQEEAVRCAKTHAKSNVFSYQDHFTGQRRFLVSTYDEFWTRYSSMDSKLRHHYEVIQEGLPCHLYFDLEFNKELNADRNVDEMVDTLICVTLDSLSEKYSIDGNHEAVVELDSSTDEKFSRHLIIRLPKVAFKDNSHVGAFVSEICLRMDSLRNSDARVNNLYIRKDSCNSSSADHLFLDTAVYSRNRCFRLTYSSKAGKSSVLLPTGRFKCNKMSERQVFMESLICRMDDDCEKVLICKLDIDCKRNLHFDSEDIAFHSYRSDFSSTYATGKSPFPNLDAFVESISSIGSNTGKIQSWYFFSEYGLMVYSMSRSRYCERIGREHKSNHVMYVVDIQRALFYQKCHDPDCKGYRSPLRQLPLDVLPDNFVLSNFKQMENYTEVEDGSFGDDDDDDDDDDEMGWWDEAVEFAQLMENQKFG